MTFPAVTVCNLNKINCVNMDRYYDLVCDSGITDEEVDNDNEDKECAAMRFESFKFISLKAKILNCRYCLQNCLCFDNVFF